VEVKTSIERNLKIRKIKTLTCDSNLTGNVENEGIPQNSRVIVMLLPTPMIVG